MKNVKPVLVATLFALLIGCGDSQRVASLDEDVEPRLFQEVDACVITPATIAELQDSGLRARHELEAYTSKFEYVPAKDCYVQKWRFPANSFVTVSSGESGDYLFVSLGSDTPGLPRLNPNEEPVLEDVRLRPIGASLTFERKFEALVSERAGSSISTDWDGWRLYLDRQSFGEAGRTSVLLTMGNQIIVQASISGDVENVDWQSQSHQALVFSNLGNKYELIYGIPTRDVRMVNEIDSAIRKKLTLFMIEGEAHKE